MGLGKTLTMLSATIHSKDDAHRFALSSHEPGANNHPTRATLIVVPSVRTSSYELRHND